MHGCADEGLCTGRCAATVTRLSRSRCPEDHTIRPSVVLAKWFDRPLAALGDRAATQCEGEQHLDNVRQKGLLPRLKDDRSTCLLCRQFYLELCRCCWWGCTPVPLPGASLRAPRGARFSRGNSP